MELRGYDVSTGADIPELTLSISFSHHHGNPQQVSKMGQHRYMILGLFHNFHSI